MTTFTRKQIEEVMVEAIHNPENRTDGGDINWDFVDADTFMAILPHNDDVDTYNEYFNDFADKVTAQLVAHYGE